MQSNISRTESNVMSLIGKRYSNRAIAPELNISENTVKFHLKNVYKKLGVHNRTEVIYKLSKNK